MSKEGSKVQFFSYQKKVVTLFFVTYTCFEHKLKYIQMPNRDNADDPILINNKNQLLVGMVTESYVLIKNVANQHKFIKVNNLQEQIIFKFILKKCSNKLNIVR